MRVTTVESWATVAQSYHRIVEDQLAETELIQSMLKTAVPDFGELDPKEVANQLLVYTNDLVRYTGVEFGESAIVPSSLPSFG